MLARIVLGFMLVFASVNANADTQPQLPGLEHPDDLLKATWIFNTNIELVEWSKLPQAVSKTLGDIEVAFEMGDGYYDLKANAVYRVTDPLNPSVVVGYMQVSVLSYTEDPEYYVPTLYVNPTGRLLNEDWVRETPPYQKEEIEADFPPELQIPADEE